MPKRPHRPADVIGNAVHVMKVLTGEANDAALDDGKDPATKLRHYPRPRALARRGGLPPYARAVEHGQLPGRIR